MNFVLLAVPQSLKHGIDSILSMPTETVLTTGQPLNHYQGFNSRNEQVENSPWQPFNLGSVMLETNEMLDCQETLLLTNLDDGNSLTKYFCKFHSLSAF